MNIKKKGKLKVEIVKGKRATELPFWETNLNPITMQPINPRGDKYTAIGLPEKSVLKAPVRLFTK